MGNQWVGYLVDGEHRPRPRQMMVALFRPKLPWCFDHGLHHYGRFADCTAPLRRISSESPSRMPDGWAGRSLLASRSTRRLNRAKNCSPVSAGAELLATSTPSCRADFVRDVDPRPREHAKFTCVLLRCCLSRDPSRTRPFIQVLYCILQRWARPFLSASTPYA